MNMTSSQSWQRSMQQGQQAFQNRKFKAAVRFFDIATKNIPTRAEGWLNLGIARVENGALESGLLALENAIGMNPKIMLAQMAVGDVQRQLGNWEAAIAAYQRAVALQRTPMSLNQLASALRVARRATESELLYKEALQMEPGFSLAQVNLATVQLELQNFEEARKLLSGLASLPLSPLERNEVARTSLALALYFRIQPGLDIVLQQGDLEPLHQALCEVPDRMLETDQRIMDGIRQYANSASKLSLPVEPIATSLPDDWPLIEGLFMIPLVETVSEYRKMSSDLATGIRPAGDLMESINMVPVVRAARMAGDVLQDPLIAEMHLRHWHALATNDIPGLAPGQFKMTRNLVHKSTKERVHPHLVTGSMRSFFSEIYSDFPPGMARGLVTMMAIADIHPFEDANGRLELSILNRELEWTGQMPALFTRELGFGAQLSHAKNEVRQNNGDLSSLVPIIHKGQQYAREFCAELAQTKPGKPGTA